MTGFGVWGLRMGGSGAPTTRLDAAKSFLTGMLAAQIAAIFTNPIDVVKIRLQIQGEAREAAAAAAARPNRPAIGLFGMFWHISKEEGVMALQKGIVPSLLRETFYSSIRLSAYEPIRDLILSEHELRSGGAPFYKKFAAGGTAGAIGAGLANPADLIKVRMQAASGSAYTSTWSAFVSIYKEEGLAGLYRGTVPTVQRAAILTATQLGVYDHVKHAILARGWFSEGKPLHFVSGTIAGFFVALTTSPVDTLRTRLMNQPLDSGGRGKLYRSMLDCAVKTVRNEGILAVYKGFFAQWMRVGPHTTISLVAWEWLRRLVGLHAI